MPIPTASPSQANPPPLAEAVSRPWLFAAAGAYCLAELLAGLSLGGFFLIGRAEALIFLALRPWLLVIAVWLVSGWLLRRRALFYLVALLLAAAGECLLVLQLGADRPWQEAGRGLLAGLLLAAAADAAAQLGRRMWGKAGTGLALALALLLFVLPGGLRLYERIAFAEPGDDSGSRPDLMLMTGLPLAWGEKGPLDPGSKPAAAYRVLDELFTISSLDVLDEASLGRGRLLLLAQPHRLAPTELAALDRWVRGGGRVLILADPQLDWPSELPVGDIRRPPPVHLLRPLLEHWGIRIEGGSAGGAQHRHIRRGPSQVRIALPPLGAARATPPCRAVDEQEWALRCPIGSGVAVVVADADWLRDQLWAPFGAKLHERTADNPFLLTSWLDELGGHDRSRKLPSVSWIDADADRLPGILLALLPGLAAASPWAVRRLHRH